MVNEFNKNFDQFRKRVGGRDESFGITLLLKFNALGYTISPLFGYLATALIIILVFLGLVFVFLQTYIIREFLYYPEE